MKKLVFIVLALSYVARTAAADSSAAATPPMGLNSWNHFACTVTAADVRSAADAISSNGMKDAGYIYVNIDDCWEGGRDENEGSETNDDHLHMRGHYIARRSLDGQA